MGAYLSQNRPRYHITLEEAADRFDVLPCYLATAVRAGRLPFQRTARCIWVTAGNVEALLQRDNALRSEQDAWAAQFTRPAA